MLLLTLQLCLISAWLEYTGCRASQDTSVCSCTAEKVALLLRRCGGIAWGDDSLALLYESWYKTRRSRVWVIAPGNPGKQPQVLFDRDYEDAYLDPGSPANRRTTRGTYVLAQIEGTRQLIMQGGPLHYNIVSFLIHTPSITDSLCRLLDTFFSHS